MKILYVTTVGRTMSFFKSFIYEFLQEGNMVDIATNEQEEAVPECYREWGCKVYQINCTRSLVCMGNLRAIWQLKELVSQNKYDIVHCHTPIASACTRLACRELRKKGIKIIYTAHGFHFFKGAPLKNWLIYYPAERFLSRWTDCLITINREDYRRAKTKLHANKTKYIPGVGIDVKKFQVPDFVQEIDGTSIPFLLWKQRKREELGVTTDDFVIVSVGELNTNKNHKVIIEAVAQLKNKEIKYLICGEGKLKDELKKLIKKRGLEKQVFLLGFCDDVRKILWMGDLFAFPSKREGLGLAAIEAMTAGLPIITSNVHGINDYSVHGETGYQCQPDDIGGFRDAINRLRNNEKERQTISEFNGKKALRYDQRFIISEMKKIYFDEV